MGGCRCTYRRCQSSTATTPGLHYFHFPVRDPARCEKWIENARKPAFRILQKNKLRNKVVCSLHFEEKYFTNKKHDRLVHNAIPTCGFEDDDSIDVKIDNLNTYKMTPEDNIMLIPIDDDNTKFTLPSVEFDGMSYTIFDDAVIPTSKIEEVIIKELEDNPTTKVKSVVKKIKTNLPLYKTKGKLNEKSKLKTIDSSSNNKVSMDICGFDSDLQSSQNTIVFNDIDNNQMICTDFPNMSAVEREDIVTTSFIVNACNDDLSVPPTTETHIIPDIIENYPDPFQVALSEYSKNKTIEETSLDNQDLQDVNKFKTISSATISLGENFETVIETNPISITNVLQNAEEIEQNVITIDGDIKQNNENMETKYLKMIKSNTKEINHLKKMMYKQSKFNNILWNNKKFHKRRRHPSRSKIISCLKSYLKPSLLAIIKLELLSQDEIMLTDVEEKFISDLYTENSDCYNVLKNKFGWNLPDSERNTSSTMECNN